MSLRLLVDEDTLAKALVGRLRKAGHDVLTVHEAGLTGEPDDRVLEHARRENRFLLTRNWRSFALSMPRNRTRRASVRSIRIGTRPRT